VVRELDRLRVEVVDLRASRRRLALADDAELRGIERELHNGVQQHLVALAVGVQLAPGLVDADPVAAKASLEEIGRDLRLALDEAGKLAHRIYPPLLETGGLAAALRSAAVHARVPTRIDVEADATYPPEVARAVYLCCLAVLHAAAADTQAAVTVRGENATLAFDVVADRAVPGVDLDRERDRVEALGGRLTIGSKAGGVTRVAGSIPVSE
jgi:signal transduction histidine kinase